jgi:hypothetical protein
VRPIERIGGPLESVPPVVPSPRGERPDRRTERDPQRDERSRKGAQRPVRRRPPPDPGEGHVDVLA